MNLLNKHKGWVKLKKINKTKLNKWKILLKEFIKKKCNKLITKNPTLKKIKN